MVKVKSVIQAVQALFFLSLLVVCFFGILNAIKTGSANLQYYKAKTSLLKWEENLKVENIDDYDNALRAIKASLKLVPENPLYLDMYSSITEWGFISDFESSEQYKLVEKILLLSVEKRPNWPVTWANLAILKWRLQEFDADFERYLNMANILGPQKAEVHILFSLLGITLYNENHPLYPKYRETIHRRLSIGLRSNISRPRIFNFIKKHEQKSTICRWLDKDDVFLRADILRCAA